jgi:hypothetical protein
VRGLLFPPTSTFFALDSIPNLIHINLLSSFFLSHFFVYLSEPTSSSSRSQHATQLEICW